MSPGHRGLPLLRGEEGAPVEVLGNRLRLLWQCKMHSTLKLSTCGLAFFNKTKQNKTNSKWAESLRLAVSSKGHGRRPRGMGLAASAMAAHADYGQARRAAHHRPCALAAGCAAPDTWATRTADRPARHTASATKTTTAVERASLPGAVCAL